MTIELKKSLIGSLLGGAVGDALGAPLEFKTLNQIQNKYGPDGLDHYIEGTGFQGFITDDTQMTLFTAEGILCAKNNSIRNGNNDAEIDFIYRSYLRWLKTQDGERRFPLQDNDPLNIGWLVSKKELFQVRAPGMTCLSSLRSGNCGHWEQPINNSKGCGGIMRAAPAGLFYYKDPQQAFQSASQAAAITHGHPSGYLSAGFLAALIAFILLGNDLPSAIKATIEILKTWPDHQECLVEIQKALLLYNDGGFSLEKIQLLGEGWVGEETLSISIYCALHFQNNFRGGVRAAANHSGDCDSTGAVTGNILGALLGMDCIPSMWIDNLAEAGIVIKVGEDLFKGVTEDPEINEFTWRERYPES